MSIGLSDTEIQEAIYTLMRKNKLENAYIRITVTRGNSEIGFSAPIPKETTFVIIIRAFEPLPNNFYKNGVKVIITDVSRNTPSSINPLIKTTSTMNSILSKIETKNSGAFEGIMLNTKGCLTEGTITNLFWLKEDTIYTPSLEAGILEGVTRQAVIEVTQQLPYLSFEEGLYFPDKLYQAEEVFITS